MALFLAGKDVGATGATECSSGGAVEPAKAREVVDIAFGKGEGVVAETAKACDVDDFDGGEA